MIGSILKFRFPLAIALATVGAAAVAQQSDQTVQQTEAGFLVPALRSCAFGSITSELRRSRSDDDGWFGRIRKTRYRSGQGSLRSGARRGSR